jgi:hypothetical protein
MAALGPSGVASVANVNRVISCPFLHRDLYGMRMIDVG